MPFADNTFDAVISIGSFEMIGEERPLALSEMIRVAKQGARIGIAEPMCQNAPIPEDLDDNSPTANSFQKCFRSVQWNSELFQEQGLKVVESYYFPEARRWWLDYRDQHRISKEEQDFITRDNDRWISLGLVVGEKSQF